MRHIRVATVVFALLMLCAVLPMPAHAAGGLNSTQIQAVLGLLKSFNVDSETVGAIQAQLEDATITTGSGSTNTNTNTQGTGNQQGLPPQAFCGQLERSLNHGSQGDDVSQLQNFLQHTGDLPVGTTTGFFGDVTEHALQQWQMREGIVSSSSDSSTGLGTLGPKSRMILMMRCKEMSGQGNVPRQDDSRASSTAPFATDTSAGPICILRASRDRVDAGAQVTLYWMSKNATYSSSVTGGQGPTQGAIVVTVQQTTTYLKKVYDANGNEGQCTKTVEVKGTTPATEKKIVIVPTKIDVARVFSLMGDGMASVMDGYLSLFGMSLQ